MESLYLILLAALILFEAWCDHFGSIELARGASAIGVPTRESTTKGTNDGNHD